MIATIIIDRFIINFCRNAHTQIFFFYLIQKIGSAKANYTALVYPMLALATSAYFENFVFNIFNLVGFALIIVALAIEFNKSNSTSSNLDKFWIAAWAGNYSQIFN